MILTVFFLSYIVIGMVFLFFLDRKWLFDNFPRKGLSLKENLKVTGYCLTVILLWFPLLFVCILIFLFHFE